MSLPKNRVFVWGIHNANDASIAVFVLPKDHPRTPDAYSQILGEIPTKYKRAEAPWAGQIHCHTKDSDALVEELVGIMEKCGFNVVRRPLTQEEDHAMHHTATTPRPAN